MIENLVRKKCNAAGLVAEEALKLYLLADLPPEQEGGEKYNVAQKHKNFIKKIRMKIDDSSAVLF